MVTLGGGSSHDAGKGVALVAANGGKIHDYEGVDKSDKPMAPLIAINTTAGTGSELTKFTIITDSARHVKMPLSTNMLHQHFLFMILISWWGCHLV